MFKKKLFIPVLITMAITMCTSAFAGEWKQDNVGWWYLMDDGNYVKGYKFSDEVIPKWRWIDGNNDGVAEYYAFDENGYMYSNTEIDNKKVNADGAMLDDEGKVKTRKCWKSSCGYWLEDGWTYHMFENGDMAWDYNIIDDKVYFFDSYRNTEPYRGSYDPDYRQLDINKDGFWEVNGTAVTPGSDLYNTLRKDIFSGKYRIYMLKDDGGVNYIDNDMRVISLLSKPEDVGPLKYSVVSYYKHNGSWKKANTLTYQQSMDKNGRVILKCNDIQGMGFAFKNGKLEGWADDFAMYNKVK